MKPTADGMKKTPKILDKIVDTVLAYKPKPKSKKAKKRVRKAKKSQRRESCI
jgi:hypothetical protein